jgi:aryl-phospho-beta-D-glucosidase BglC (GH1 family)
MSIFKVVNAIRANDANAIIILGTPTWSQDVDVAAQSPVTGTNLMYTLHYYAATHKQSLRDKAQAALNKVVLRSLNSPY